MSQDSLKKKKSQSDASLGGTESQGDSKSGAAKNIPIPPESQESGADDDTPIEEELPEWVVVEFTVNRGARVCGEREEVSRYRALELEAQGLAKIIKEKE